MELVSHRLLRSVALSARPQAADGSPAAPFWAGALAAVVVLILATDLLAPNHFGGGALVVLPVLAASWVLGRRALAAVIAVAATIEVAGLVHGDLSWLMVGGRLVTIVVVALVGRAAAVALAEVRRARLREIGTLLRSSQRMGRPLDESGVAAEAVRVAAGTLVTAGRSAIRHAALVRMTGGRATVLASQDDAGVTDTSVRGIGIAGVPAAVRETLASGRPTVLRSADLDPELRALAAQAGGDEWALTRVQVAGQPYGILAAASGGGQGFHREDLRLLEGIARVTGLAVAAALQHTELAQLQRRLQHSVELALDVGRSLDPAKVVDSILVRMSESVGADHATLARANGGAVVIESAYRPDAGRVVPRRRHFPREVVEGVPALATALASGQPVTGGPPEVASGAGDLAAELPRGPHTMILPLVVDGRTACLLALGRGGERPFGPADLAQLEPMADVALLALRNADVHAQDVRLLADAREAGEAKTTFLNLAAHELRTPLAVIRGYLSLLEDGTYPVPDRTREAVETLVQKAQELESLVETLVTAARLEGGTLPRSVVPLDVAQAVREAVDRARPRARLEGAQIDVRAPAGGVVARADRGHVARILDNLLNNALTYSESPASVTVELRPRDPIEVAVRDLGQGIPPDQQDRVFERFHRVDGSAPRPGAGLGLGLSISRELARLNGGALELERSAPGRGSVFVLRLPARKAG